MIDFLISSEHSENEKLPITTAATCIDPSGIPAAIAALDLAGIVPPLACANVDQSDHYRKWDETLAQSIEGSERRLHGDARLRVGRTTTTTTSASTSRATW